MPASRHGQRPHTLVGTVQPKKISQRWLDEYRLEVSLECGHTFWFFASSANALAKRARCPECTKAKKAQRRDDAPRH